MVQHMIILGHEIFRQGIEVDKVKIEVIAKLPTPKYVKDIRSFSMPIYIVGSLRILLKLLHP